MKFKAPKGTRDILPSDIHKWHQVQLCFFESCRLFGYQEIRIPTFEQTDVFSRGVGNTTDIVQKEMYTFLDKGKRSMTLRPEGTAGIVRSFIENGMHSLPYPVKLFYDITAFRYENVQKGRMREFHQFGIEAFGASGSEMDAEVISLMAYFFGKIGLKKIDLRLNSIGCPTCRPPYQDKLRSYYKDHLESMCVDCRKRYKTNPIRMLDCKVAGCASLAKTAPRQLDGLCSDCSSHFDQLCRLLDDMKIPYHIDPNIVRGLDYYTKNVFEFVSENVGTQGTISAGGRYDYLVETMGGAPVAGVGFAMGVERLLMEMEAQYIAIKEQPPFLLYIAHLDGDLKMATHQLAYILRKSGISCQAELAGRSFRAQLKYADKIGVPFILVIGHDEQTSGRATIKRMKDGKTFLFLLEDPADAARIVRDNF